MNATMLNTRWNDGAENESWPASSTTRSLFCRIGVEPRVCRCPSCDSPVYSRRHDLCGVCGETLPDYCRFTDSEARNVQTLIRYERERHRAWLKRTTVS